MASTKRIIAMLVFGAGLLLPAAAAVAAPQYVALGDSYSSGVGTRVFYEESGECSRSPDAYGPKVAAAKGYSLNFEACGGAKTPEVNSKQLGKLSATTSLVTITIGGNDAGFSNVIINCALYYFTCGSAIGEANEFIKNKRQALPGSPERIRQGLHTAKGQGRSRHRHEDSDERSSRQDGRGGLLQAPGDSDEG